MPRRLGWLCLLPALASLTTTHAVAAATASKPVSNSTAAAPTLAAVPDYGPATWVPADPANYTVANRGHDYPVQLIVIHDTEGSYASAIQEFQDPTWAGSAHYVVSYTGDITQMVAEKDIAWHAGNWDYNTRAIGIEHEGYAWACSCYTDAEYDASARLIASICSRWGIPMNRENVIGHDQVPDPNNPGLFGGSDHHTDPGPYWDWTDYINRAAYYATLLPSPPHLMPDPYAVLTSATSATVSWQPAATCRPASVPITGYTVTDQAHNLTMNLPASATSATFTGLTAGTTYTFTVTATNADGHDAVIAPWRCSAAHMSTAPTTPQLSGTSVQLSATSSGCPNPVYQFWLLAPGGSWTSAQTYSGNAGFTWNTTGAAAGTYYVSLWARDASSPGAVPTGLGNFDAYVPGTPFTLTTMPCKSASASAAPPSPTMPGTGVTFTAGTSGCPKPLYQFWMLAPGASSWTVAQAYSNSATFNWNTTGLTGGAYHFSVWVRDASSTGTSCNSLGCSDAFVPGFTYTLGSSPCASVTDSAAPPPPSASGTGVTFTGMASGCSSPRYQFWILAPGSSGWTVAQAYSNNAAFNWTTTGLPGGTYYFSVWARDATSAGTSCNSLGCSDAFVPGFAYTLTSTQCASVTASETPPSTAARGTGVAITGNASGCPNPLYEFWILTPGSSTWTVAQGYSANATFNWTTTGLPAGTYHFSVWVRDAGSTGTSCNSLGCEDAYVPGFAYTLT